MIRRTFARFLVSALVLYPLSRHILAQSAGALPKFEASEIHTSPHVTFPFMDGGNLHGDRYALRQASMADMIAEAYHLDTPNVQGGPSWLEMDRFEVSAKAAAPATSHDDLRLMLRSMLADRFHLVVHNGYAPLPAFVLSPGKDKHKMKEAAGTGEPGCEGQPPPPDQAPSAIPTIVVNCRNISMDRFVEELRNMAGGYLTLPVVNSTGLAGNWDFELRWTPRGALDRAGADGVSIFDAVSRELGLSLAQQTAPRSVLIVDSVDESPTPNSPDIEKLLPPLPPAQFEVAVIKPAKADAQLTGRISRRSGRRPWCQPPLRHQLRLGPQPQRQSVNRERSIVARF
jgi:uncharacterized protein (TIGR03435 family)